jgi:hypothetical protein
MSSTGAGIPVIAAEHGERTRVLSIGMHAVAAVLLFLSPLALFAPVAFINSGLRNGRKGLVGTVGAAALLLALFVAGTSASAGVAAQLATLLRLVTEVAIPAALATLLIRQSAPAGEIVFAAAGLSALGFGMSELLMRALFRYSPWEAIVAAFDTATSQTIEMYRRGGWPSDGINAMERVTEALSPGFLPALLGSVTLLTFVLSLAVVPRLPAGRATGTSYLFRYFSLPDVLLFAFVAGGLAPLVSGPLRTAGLNLLVVVVLLYTLQGLAIFRMLTVRAGFGVIGTALSWVLLFVVSLYGFGIVMLFLAGLFDSFFDFRKLKRKDVPDESHTD